MDKNCADCRKILGALGPVLTCVSLYLTLLCKIGIVSR
jgi:hypothetical protein